MLLEGNIDLKIKCREASLCLHCKCRATFYESISYETRVSISLLSAAYTLMLRELVAIQQKVDVVSNERIKYRVLVKMNKLIA